jgi:hypothetical protein
MNLSFASKYGESFARAAYEFKEKAREAKYSPESLAKSIRHLADIPDDASVYDLMDKAGIRQLKNTEEFISNHRDYFKRASICTASLEAALEKAALRLKKIHNRLNKYQDKSGIDSNDYGWIEIGRLYLLEGFEILRAKELAKPSRLRKIKDNTIQKANQAYEKAKEHRYIKSLFSLIIPSKSLKPKEEIVNTELLSLS